jgi:hypothetical protein
MPFPQIIDALTLTYTYQGDHAFAGSPGDLLVMRNNVIMAAVAIGLQLSYTSVGQFVQRQDPWPILCVLFVLLIASVAGFLRRDAQITIFSYE